VEFGQKYRPIAKSIFGSDWRAKIAEAGASFEKSSKDVDVVTNSAGVKFLHRSKFHFYIEVFNNLQKCARI